MKKLTFLFTLLFLSTASFAQGQLRASMGVDYTSTPSFYDYINQNFAPSNNQLGSFNASIIFSGEGDIDVSKSYQVGIELGYKLYSYNTQNTIGQYDISYHNIMPTLVNYYVINGDSYQFKIGGGAGLRLLSVDESIPGTGSTQTYKSTGFGLLLRGAGNTKLSGNFYINIGADVRYDFNGEPKNNGNPLVNHVSRGNVNFNSLSFGLSLGLTYFL